MSCQEQGHILQTLEGPVSLDLDFLPLSAASFLELKSSETTRVYVHAVVCKLILVIKENNQCTTQI